MTDHNYRPVTKFHTFAVIDLLNDLSDNTASEELASEEGWFANAEDGDLINLLSERISTNPYNADIRPFLVAESYTTASAKEFLSSIVVTGVRWEGKY